MGSPTRWITWEGLGITTAWGLITCNSIMATCWLILSRDVAIALLLFAISLGMALSLIYEYILGGPGLKEVWDQRWSHRAGGHRYAGRYAGPYMGPYMGGHEEI